MTAQGLSGTTETVAHDGRRPRALFLDVSDQSPYLRLGRSDRVVPPNNLIGLGNSADYIGIKTVHFRLVV